MEKNFNTKEELFDHLIENKEDLMYAKKCTIKQGDSLDFEVVTKYENGVEVPMEAFKSGDERLTAVKVSSQDASSGVVKVEAVINTTNWMDSHKDVHINGIWNRSIKNNKRIKHLQEHEMRFDKIIADKEDLKVSVEEFTWKELGYDMEGKTEALLFKSTVKEERNPAMFKEYGSGNVDNHSVGMQYVKLKLAVNSDKDGHKEEKANWDTYFPMVANKKEAERHGYFWAVLEAKAHEGSAVVNGSNSMTPTLSRDKHIEVEETQPDTLSLEESELNKFFNIKNEE